MYLVSYTNPDIDQCHQGVEVHIYELVEGLIQEFQPFAPFLWVDR